MAFKTKQKAAAVFVGDVSFSVVSGLQVGVCWGGGKRCQPGTMVEALAWIKQLPTMHTYKHAHTNTHAYLAYPCLGGHDRQGAFGTRREQAQTNGKVTAIAGRGNTCVFGCMYVCVFVCVSVCVSYTHTHTHTHRETHTHSTHVHLCTRVTHPPMSLCSRCVYLAALARRDIHHP